MKEQVLEEYLEIENEVIAECNKRLEVADKFDINGILQTKSAAAGGIFAAVLEIEKMRKAAREWDRREEVTTRAEAVNQLFLDNAERQTQLLKRLEAVLDRMEAKQ